MGDHELQVMLRFLISDQEGRYLLDVKSSYPHGEIALNTCKETTEREIVEIQGIPEEVFRMENMGFSAGHTNAMQWCNKMLGFPSHFEMLKAFCQDKGIEPKHGFEEAKDVLYEEHSAMFKVPASLSLKT